MENYKTWDIVNSVIKHSQRVLLYGPPATGKTYAAMRESLQGRKAYAITVTPDMSMAEIRGHYVPSGDKFVWKDGIAVTAWREGARLVINEIADASEDVLVFLHAILDDPGFAEYTLPTGEIVKPANGFQVVATTNREPESLHEALRDRFPVAIEVNEVNPKAIENLPVYVREAIESTANAQGDRRITIRLWKEYIKLSRAIGEERAAIAVFRERAQDILDALMIGQRPQKVS